MKFLTFESKGFKRLSVAKIAYIKIDFVRKFHWILGTNGAGKSSLASELSVLPARPQNYLSGGFKKLELIDKGVRYRLTSDFTGPKNIFSFVRFNENDVEEELNPGHTSTVFTNLVLQHFGYTKEVHEFAIGVREFSALSPNDRKYWITKLSAADYTYALNFFQKLVSQYRDNLGSIKTDQNRLIEAKSKLISGDDQNLLELEIASLKERANYLVQVIPHPGDSKDYVKSQLELLIREEEAGVAKANSIISELRHERPFPSLAVAEDRKQTAENALVACETRASAMFERIEELRVKADQYRIAQNINKNEVHKTIESLSKILDELSGSITFVEVADPYSALEKVVTWSSEVDQLADFMIADPDNEYSPENYELQEKRLRGLMTAKNSISSRNDVLVSQLETARTCGHQDDVTCPSCDHTWSLKNDPRVIGPMEEELRTNSEKLPKIEGLIAEVEVFKKRYNQKATQTIYLNNLQAKYPEFSSFWGYVHNEKIVENDPQELKRLTTKFQIDLGTMVKMADHRKELTKALEEAKLVDAHALTYDENIFKEMKELEKNLDLLYEQRETLFAEKVRQKKLRDGIVALRELNQKALEFAKREREIYKQSRDHFIRDGLNDILLQLNVDIAAKEKQLRSVEIQMGQIQMLESNLEASKAYSQVLKAAVDELSPSKGLIARGLTGFINHFVGLVNSIIRKVWLYEMSVIPIVPDEDDNIDLNFKFKVSVKGEEVPDIADCSSGQKEIINLAFRIVALAFLKMDNGPLFLDEFGARMDAAHKASAFEMIEKLLSTSNFSQIFMISHFESVFSNGIDADLTVLCPANINLPAGISYNQNTTIK